MGFEHDELGSFQQKVGSFELSLIASEDPCPEIPAVRGNKFARLSADGRKCFCRPGVNCRGVLDENPELQALRRNCSDVSMMESLRA